MPTTTAPDNAAGGEPEQVVGHVVEEDADVRRPVGVAQLVEQRGAPPALLDQLAVRPRAVADEQRGVVVVGSAGAGDPPSSSPHHHITE